MIRQLVTTAATVSTLKTWYHVPMLSAPWYRGRCCVYSILYASTRRSISLFAMQKAAAHGAAAANIVR